MLLLRLPLDLLDDVVLRRFDDDLTVDVDVASSVDVASVAVVVSAGASSSSSSSTILYCSRSSVSRDLLCCEGYCSGFELSHRRRSYAILDAMFLKPMLVPG